MLKVYRVALIKRKNKRHTELVHCPWPGRIDDEDKKIVSSWRFSCREGFLRPFLRRLEEEFLSKGDSFTVACAPCLSVFVH